MSDGTDTYLYGLGRVAQQSGPDWGYYLADGLGSVRQVTAYTNIAGASPTRLLSQSFDPYGNPVHSSGDATSNYGFSGEWVDGTGLINLRARYLNTGIGRFITRDTWPGNYQRPLSLNGWNYVEGNPINYTDPSGHGVCFFGIDPNTGFCNPSPFGLNSFLSNLFSIGRVSTLGPTAPIEAVVVVCAVAVTLLVARVLPDIGILPQTDTRPNASTVEELESLAPYTLYQNQYEPQSTLVPPIRLKDDDDDDRYIFRGTNRKNPSPADVALKRFDDYTGGLSFSLVLLKQYAHSIQFSTKALEQAGFEWENDYGDHVRVWRGEPGWTAWYEQEQNRIKDPNNQPYSTYTLLLWELRINYR